MALHSDPLDVNKFDIKDFSGGLRRNVDPSKLSESQYPLLVNMRSRYGTLKSIKLPKYFDEFPSGKFQGAYAQGSQILVFVSGKAYYRNFEDTQTSFRLLPSFLLDSNVDYIYAEAVPTSYYNFGREASTDNLNITKTATFSSPSPACIVCQDGINQPWLIFSTGGVSKAKTFQEWSQEDRQYVPIGKQMLYHDGILYVVSPDGRKLYRSVSGRALDFVIAIDTDGNKLQDNLYKVEAERLAHNINNAEITCLAKLSIGSSNPNFGSPFLVGTKIGSFKIEPNFSNLLFGEPTFRNTSVFPTAPLNQASFTYSRGDLHFIDETGLRSYNLTESVGGIVSKDDAVSAGIYTLFEGVQQTVTAIAFFDNYTFYGVQTAYGYSIILYDNLRNSFEALDIFEGLSSPIKMFCQTNILGVKTLYFITTEGFYQYYGDSTTAPWQFYSKEFSTDDSLMHHKIIRFRAVLQDSFENGLLTAIPIADRKKEAALTKKVFKTLDAITYPLEIPFGQSDTETTQNISFVFQKSKQSDKIGMLLKGDFNAEIISLHLHTEQMEAKTPLEQSSQVYQKGY